MTIPFEQAQRDLAKLLEKVAAGEEMVITRDGRPVARVVAVDGGPSRAAAGGAPATRRLGWGKSMIISIAPDFDAPLEDFREYME